MALLALLLTTALAQSPGTDVPKAKVGFTTSLSTAFVAGPVGRKHTGQTLTGVYEEGATFNPRLDVALRLGLRARLRPLGFLTVSWAVRRDVVFADTRSEGFAPGTGGTTSSQVLDTTDLSVAYSDFDVVAWEAGDLHLTAGGRLTLPASRTSLVCNPLIAGVGADVGVWKGLGEVTTISLDASVDKVFHRFAAAPRGRCGVPLRGVTTTATLTGPVTPESDRDAFVIGRTNPSWVTEGSVTLGGWHGLFGLIAGVSDRKAYQMIRTSLSVGVRSVVRRRDPEASVQTLSGPATVAASRAPAVTSVPIQGAVAVQVDKHLRTTLALSNQVPALLYDPAARLRLLPATTTVSLAVQGAW